MEITFTTNPKSLFHEDLYIYIPELGINGYSDTYYFADDNGILPGEMSEAKVKIVLKNLLNDWKEAVEDLQNGHKIFLPFDFSDQSISALKVQRENNNLVIHQAWTPASGGMSPSFMNKVSFKDEMFNVYGNSLSIPVEQFLFEIQREHDKIR